MAEVFAVMGGVQVLGRAPTNSQEWMRRIGIGLPAQTAVAFKNALQPTDDQFAALLGLSRRSINRLASEKAALPIVAGDRLYRSARLFALAIDVFEDRGAAANWLKTPQRALGNVVPVDIATTYIGAAEVETLLGRIAHGVYS
jgi:putative toxin-antitoxin system antitoxin component (TIGR02293 family)